MLQFCWISLRTGYDGDVYYTVISNCFVHMVMYSYYECTALNIKVEHTSIRTAPVDPAFI